MCGRYVFYTDKEIAEINNIIQLINEKQKEFSKGEIFPSNYAPAMFYNVDKLDADAFMWGFPKFGGPGVIINARSETVAEKPTFKESFFNRRCVIPTMGFYEWSKDKKKYLFTNPASEVMYLAGIYRPVEGANRFVILTTEANSSMIDIHERMPVILTKNDLEEWCHDYDSAVRLLHGDKSMLEKRIEDKVQQELF